MCDDFQVTGTLRQSLEVEVLGMDEQMFEEKQRDERLAFKVIQHVVRCAPETQNEKKPCVSLAPLHAFFMRPLKQQH